MPKEKAEPVRQSVVVDCPIEDAFALFTDRFAKWWPLSDTCRMEPGIGGRIFERSRSGEERALGWITRWEPPSRLSFTWDGEQRVDVCFSVVADGTRVTVVHTGWQNAGIEMALRCFSSLASHEMVLFA